MKRKHTKEDLVELFRSAAARHFTASLAGDYRSANREATTISQSFRQLKDIGDEGYQALMTLLEDENKAVETMAAAYLLKYATDVAISVLRKNAQDEGLIGFKSQQALERWREGDWHLDE